MFINKPQKLYYIASEDDQRCPQWLVDVYKKQNINFNKKESISKKLKAIWAPYKIKDIPGYILPKEEVQFLVKDTDYGELASYIIKDRYIEEKNGYFINEIEAEDLTINPYEPPTEREKLLIKEYDRPWESKIPTNNKYYNL